MNLFNYLKGRLTFLILFLSLSLTAQTTGITENGDEVILYDDGTWEYTSPDELEKSEIPFNEESFEKKPDATFLLKSKVIDVGFYLNPKKWTFSKSDVNSDAEYEVQHKDEDLFGIIITEKIEIPLENLRNIALKNARSVAPDLKVTKEEYRMVNGIKVLHMRMNGTMEGIKFSYLGYYYSFEGGTVQYLTYTSESLMDEFKEECEVLLNGLTQL